MVYYRRCYKLRIFTNCIKNKTKICIFFKNLKKKMSYFFFESICLTYSERFILCNDNIPINWSYSWNPLFFLNLLIQFHFKYDVNYFDKLWMNCILLFCNNYSACRLPFIFIIYVRKSKKRIIKLILDIKSSGEVKCWNLILEHTKYSKLIII